MSILKKMLSATLSCSIACTPAALSAEAAKIYSNYFINNNIKLAESKEEISDDEKPFNVFEIYNAYYGITTTKATTRTTTKATTTTTTTESTTTSTTSTTTETTTTSTTSTTTTETTTLTASTTTESTTTTSATTTISKPITTTSAAIITSFTSTAEKITTTSNLASTENTATTKSISVNNTTATKKTTTTTKPSVAETTAKTTTTAKKTTLNTTVLISATASSITDITTAADVTTTDIIVTDDITTATSGTVTISSETAPTTQSVFLKGIDVSQFQLNIDWNKVKASGEADFAIIRAGYGKELNQEDPYFDYNMQNAQAAGMDVGIYWYSYAYSVEDAVKEAETCYQIIKDYSFSYPVYFDVEEYGQMFNLTKAQLSAIVDAFCSTLEAKGYYVGVYSSASYLQSNIYEHVLQKYDVWVAEYNSGIYHYNGHYGIWQYSSTGSVDGIPAAVDLNYCYKNYPEIIGVNPESGRIPPATAPISTDTTATAVTTTTSPIVYGVGVSAGSGSLDVSAINKDEYSFVILKAGEGGETPQVDPDFTTNLISAKEEGINCGAYWCAKALTEEDILREAEMFLFMIQGYQFEYPLYLDMTDSVYADSGLSPEEMTALIKSFCSLFEEHGYYIGVHVTEDFLAKSVTSEFFELYDVWLDCSETGESGNKFKHGLLKSKEITIDGIEGNVYVNTCFRNYPSVMKYYELNGF